MIYTYLSLIGLALILYWCFQRLFRRKPKSAPRPPRKLSETEKRQLAAFSERYEAERTQREIADALKYQRLDDLWDNKRRK